MNISTEESIYRLLQGDDTVGPFSLRALEEMLNRGEIEPERLCTADCMIDWAPVGQFVIDPVKWLKKAPVFPPAWASTPPTATAPIAPAPASTLCKCPDCGKDVSKRAASCPNCGAPIAVRQPMAAQPVQHVVAVPQRYPKSRAAYVVLALLVGATGVHNFYAGYVGRGLVQLAVLVTLGWLILPAVVLWIVAIVEACTVNADAYGVAMD